jgi:hypothetical protein
LKKKIKLKKENMNGEMRKKSGNRKKEKKRNMNSEASYQIIREEVII